MTKSDLLKQKIDSIRKEAVDAIRVSLSLIRDYCKEVEIEHDGNLRLLQPIAHQNIDDDQLIEMITEVHTNDLTVTFDCNGDTQDGNFDDLTSAELICILEQLEMLLADKDKIDVI